MSTKGSPRQCAPSPLAEAFLRSVDHVEDDVERPLGGADIPRPEPGIEHVPGLGDRGDQRMVDLCIIMAVPFSLRLMAMHLDRGAVDIEGDALDAFAVPLRAQPAAGQLQHRLAQNLQVGGLRHDRGKA